MLGNFRRNFDGILDEIASSFVSLTPRNDGILDGILNEIAPSALLPRNDAGNSSKI